MNKNFKETLNLMKKIHFKVVASVKIFLYKLLGSRPWSIGYEDYKQYYLRKHLAVDSILHFKDKRYLRKKYGFRLDERVVEYPWFLSKLKLNEKIILDAGSSLNHTFLLKHPFLSGRDLYIFTLDYEGFNKEKHPSYIYGDLRKTCFKKNFFDAICSISTLEHVGMDNTFLYTNNTSKTENDSMAFFSAIDEFNRILKKGGTAYITVPFGKYVNYKWFQVYDSDLINKMIKQFSPSTYQLEFFKYENNQWNFSAKEECIRSDCFDIHTDRKYKADFLAFSRSVACIEMVK